MKIEYTLKEHTESVNCITFSLDGMKIATASDDGTAIIYNANTREIE